MLPKGSFAVVKVLLLLLLCSGHLLATSEEIGNSDEEVQSKVDICYEMLLSANTILCEPSKIDLQAEIEKIFSPTPEQADQLKRLLESISLGNSQPQASSKKDEEEASDADCPPEHECVMQWQCRNETISGGCDNLKGCCHKSDMIEFPVKDDKMITCGLRHKAGVDATLNIRSDQEATFGEFPWIVAIFSKNSMEQYFIGVGSILAPNVVLTVRINAEATSISNLVVRAGEWDMTTTDELIPYQEREVSRAIFPQDDDILASIALLILHMDLSASPHISPICLPASPIEKFDTSKCIITAWGKEHKILKQMAVSLIYSYNCLDNNIRYRAWEFDYIDELICAEGKKGVNFCNIEMGSPIVCPVRGSPDQYYLIGNYEWDPTCDSRNLHIYFNVLPHTPWLNEMLEQLSVDKNYYTA